MTGEEYKALLDQVHSLRLVARAIDQRGVLDDALEMIAASEAVGPVLHPTLYRDNAQKMREDRETIEAVRALARLGKDADR